MKDEQVFVDIATKALADLSEVVEVAEGAEKVYHSALAARDSQIAEARVAGVTKKAIRQATGLSASRINQILRAEREA